MTTQRPTRPGWPARLAVLRWAWRLTRRESRSLLLLVVLLIATTATATAGLTAAAQIAPAAAVAEFGNATMTIDVDEVDDALLDRDVAAADRVLQDVEVVARGYAVVDGLFEPVELRQQDPAGPMTAPLLDLVDGRYPRGTAEVGLTDDLAALLGVAPGRVLDLGADARWTVVGTVENPAALEDSFALVTEVPGGPEAATLYARGDPSAAELLTLPSGRPHALSTRGVPVGPFAAGLVLVATTVVLLLVALLAVTAFSILAQRRRRQLGVLAATGASRPQLLLVMTGQGALLGALAATTGVLLGLGSWFLLADRLEPLLAHRVDATAVPWAFVAAAWVLTVTATAASARWPAHDVVGVPVAEALSGRPDARRPQTAADFRRGLGLVGAGLVLLLVAGPALESVVGLVLTVTGLGVVVAGTVALAPPLVGVAARRGRRSGVGVRIAVRDLARHRRRSSAALAAVAVVLAVAVGTVLASTAAIHAAGEGNLSARQLYLRIGEIPSHGDVAPIPERTPEQLGGMQAAVHDVASGLGARTVTPVQVAVVPDVEVAGAEGLVAAVLTVDAGGGFHRVVDVVHVATDPLLATYGVTLADLPPGTGLLTTRSEGGLFLEPIRPEPASPRRLDPTYTSLPGTLITPAELRRRGWRAAPAGWVLDASEPLGTAEIAQAVDRAGAAGLTVETRSGQAHLEALRTGATALAGFACLAILAATVGLVRGESAGDRRVLSAIGSTRRQQRRLAATTGGTLAVLGAGLGAVVASATVAVQAADPVAAFWPPPLWHLAALCLGVPGAVTLLSWRMART